MIQRIQTVYYAISAICLIIVSFGMTLFLFVSEKHQIIFSAYGLEKLDQQGQLVEVQSGWLFLSSVALALLCIMAILSYKNLDRQMKLGRLTLLIYILILIAMIAAFYMGNRITGEEITDKKLGIGFILFAVGFPFIFMGNLGVKRDKKLLDSLDRLR
ncbi:MAG: DUF4293 family protein [Bacteroidetes bacterium]|nr:MAG: DUF4293 family protein [Bacteroidota bacterium]